MKYFKTSYGTEIKEIEIIKETDKCIYIKNTFNGKEERVVKLGNYSNYFKSFSDAKFYLTDRKQKEVEEFINKLQKAKKELEELHNLYEK